MIRPRILGLWSFAAAIWFANPALADIPPPDACDRAGAECNNAGDNFDRPGVCTTNTCSKGPPTDRVTYECLLCEVKADPSPAPAEGSKQGDEDDGCSVSRGGAEHGLAGLLLLSGLALFARGRRR